MAVVESSHPQVESVIGTTTLGQEIDIDALSEEVPIENKRKGTFSGCVYKPENNEASLLVFHTGKITVVGAKSKEEAGLAVTDFFDKLDELGISTPSPDITYKNVVCRGELNRRVNLNAVAIGLGLENVEYEPEQFSALMYWSSTPHGEATFLVFNSGSVVLTGLSSREQARKCFNHLKKEMDELGF